MNESFIEYFGGVPGLLTNLMGYISLLTDGVDRCLWALRALKVTNKNNIEKYLRGMCRAVLQCF